MFQDSGLVSQGLIECSFFSFFFCFYNWVTAFLRCLCVFLSSRESLMHFFFPQLPLSSVCEMLFHFLVCLLRILFWQPPSPRLSDWQLLFRSVWCLCMSVCESILIERWSYCFYITQFVTIASLLAFVSFSDCCSCAYEPQYWLDRPIN